MFHSTVEIQESVVFHHVTVNTALKSPQHWNKLFSRVPGRLQEDRFGDRVWLVILRGLWMGLDFGEAYPLETPCWLTKKAKEVGGASQVILRNAKKHNIAEKIKSVNKVLAQMLTAKKIKQCLWFAMYIHTCIHKEKIISLESSWYIGVTSLWLSSREASSKSIMRWRRRGRSCFTILRIGGWRLKG